MRVAFLGSPPFATPILEQLCTSRFAPVVVVTQPDRPRGRGRALEPGAVKALAHARGVPVLQPESTRDPEFVAALRAHEPDALLVAAYGEILREDVLDLAPRGAFNVHASLLPRWRGASPIQQAILHGDATTGVTIQRMVRALDAGDVLLAVETPIGADETAGELAARLAQLGGAAAIEALARVESGGATFTPQDLARVTTCRKLDRESGAVDWSRPADELARLVRAMNPWPAARAGLEREGVVESIAVLRARVASGGGAPGAVLEAGARLVVACGGGALEVLELQSAGKKPLAAAEWVRGARLAAGARFVPPPRADA